MPTPPCPPPEGRVWVGRYVGLGQLVWLLPPSRGSALVCSIWTVLRSFGLSPSRRRIVGAIWVVSTQVLTTSPPFSMGPPATTIGTLRSWGLLPPCSAIFAFFPV